MEQGIKLSDLITLLKVIKQQSGNLELWLASDEEGNSFSPFIYKPDVGTIGIEDGKLVLYPWHQYMAEEVFK